MAKKNRIDITALDNYGNESSSAAVDKTTSNVHPNSIANLHPRKKGKTDKKYMQLDIMEFEDYLNRMAKYKGMTRTKYILGLIRADYEANKDEYEMLKNLSGFDK